MAGRPSKYERSSFGAHVRTLRQAAGLTQRQVASRLGISQPSYALWERDDVAIRPDQLRKLAEVLEVGVDELLQERRSTNRRGGPTGKARRVFEKVSKLPRHQQRRIIEVVEALVAGQRKERAHNS